MEWLVWLGAGITILGLCGVIWSIVKIVQARSAGLDDTQMRERLTKILPLNLGGLFIAMIGLMTLVIGLFLG